MKSPVASIATDGFVELMICGPGKSGCSTPGKYASGGVGGLTRNTSLDSFRIFAVVYTSVTIAPTNAPMAVAEANVQVTVPLGFTRTDLTCTVSPPMLAVKAVLIGKAAAACTMICVAPAFTLCDKIAVRSTFKAARSSCAATAVELDLEDLLPTHRRLRRDVHRIRRGRRGGRRRGRRRRVHRCARR